MFNVQKCVRAEILWAPLYEAAGIPSLVAFSAPLAADRVWVTEYGSGYPETQLLGNHWLIKSSTSRWEPPVHSGFLCKMWSDSDLNTVFEVCGTCPCCKKYYIMLVGPNLASIAFRVHCAKYCQLGEGEKASAPSGACTWRCTAQWDLKATNARFGSTNMR